ncbi:peptidylprolyl isomerase [Cystobacter fuscus]
MGRGSSLTTLNRLHFPGCCSRQSRSSRWGASQRPPSEPGTQHTRAAKPSTGRADRRVSRHGNGQGIMDSLDLRKVFSLLFIIAIAVVFTVQFGPGSNGFSDVNRSGAPAAAAVVNGKEIPLNEFRREYAGQLQYLRQQGQPITEAVARQFGLPQTVLDRLVNTELLAQAAARQGLRASDEELLRILHRSPDFQKDGQFDYATYQQVLRDYFRQSPADYEEDLRKRLSAQKLLGVVQSGVVVSDDEVRTRFAKEGNQARVVFARFLPSMYADKVPAPTPAELTAYKQAQEKAIKEYYEANRFVYQQPERVHARQILLKLAPDATPEQKAQVLARAQALRQELEGGKDFAEVASTSSEDPGTKASGEISAGWSGATGSPRSPTPPSRSSPASSPSPSRRSTASTW